MKKRIVSITLLTCGLLYTPSVIQAQAPARKGEAFETGVSLILKDSEQAKCMNEDCSIRSQEP